jgi:bifunctional DNA-binding transcriptional regulator/antitoxin component of YhaV-PrlF toxin-antitoxin module
MGRFNLPIEQCKLAGIEPGDDYGSYVDNEGHITIVRKAVNAAKGILKNIGADKRFSDHQSLESSIAP